MLISLRKQHTSAWPLIPEVKNLTTNHADLNYNIGAQSTQELFFVIGAFVELFTVMI